MNDTTQRLTPTPIGTVQTTYGRGELADVIDDFADHQTELDRIMTLNPDEFAAWLETLTPPDARGIFSRAGTVSAEHLRRAESARILTSRVREHFADVVVAGIGETGTPTHG